MAANYINAMLLLVSKFKMTGTLLNVVHGQVKKWYVKHVTKESNGFHNPSTLITIIVRGIDDLDTTKLSACRSFNPFLFLLFILH